MRELDQIKRMLFGGILRSSAMEAWIVAAHFAAFGIITSMVLCHGLIIWSKVASVALFVFVLARCSWWIGNLATKRREMVADLQDQIDLDRLMANTGDPKGPRVLRSWHGVEYNYVASTYAESHFSRCDALGIGFRTCRAIVSRAFVEVFAEQGEPLTMDYINWEYTACDTSELEWAHDRAEEYILDYFHWRDKRGDSKLAPDCCFFDSGNQRGALLAACVLLGCAALVLLVVSAPSVRLHSYLLVHALVALAAGYAAVTLWRMRFDRIGIMLGLTLFCVGVVFVGGAMSRGSWQIADCVAAACFVFCLIWLMTLQLRGSRRGLRYSGLEADHTIKDALYDGTVVRLEDGSVWQLEGGDFPLGYSDDECMIMVAESPASRRPSTYLLINLDANKKAFGRLISQ